MANLSKRRRHAATCVATCLLAVAACNPELTRPPTAADRAPNRVDLGSVGSGCEEIQDSPHCVETGHTNPGYRRGILLVRPDDDLAARIDARLRRGASGLAWNTPAFSDFARKFRVISVEQLFAGATSSPAHVAGTKVQFPERTRRADPRAAGSRLDYWFEITLDPGADLERAAAELKATGDVRFAEPDRVVKVAFTPNDQYYASGDLWGSTNVAASVAWDHATGQGVTIAVIDSGVDDTHPDLASNLWSNPGEVSGNGLDDDGNLLVDDSKGWDFVDNDNGPSDPNGHGSHVAGIAAASGNNSVGVVGIAFASRIMPVRAFDMSGSGYTSDAAAAVKYAADEGADVINNSWGGDDSALAVSVVDYAYGMGAVVVNAAGNSHRQACLASPANAENGITVSAFKKNDTQASFSNFGVKVDVGAPGGEGTQGSGAGSSTEIFSTVPNNPFVATVTGNPVASGGVGSYMPLAGTSMAAPFVSGLSALLLEAHPAWTVEEVRQQIRLNAADIMAPGFDTAAGYGRINAGAALQPTAVPPPTATVRNPLNCEHVNNTVPVTGGASTPGGAGSFAIEVGPDEVPTSWSPLGGGATPSSTTLASFNTLNWADGLHSIRARTIDPSTGKTSEDRNLVEVDNVFIATPTEHQILLGSSFLVTGMAAGNLQFDKYRLEWAPGCNAGSGFTIITSSASQVNPVGTLGNWNLGSVPDGATTIRLTAEFSGLGGFSSVDQKCVMIDRLIAPGWPVPVNQLPTFKSPKIADLDGDGSKEIVLGASVFQANGSVRPGWSNFPGLGRTNPAILDINGTPNSQEVVAAVFDGNTSSPNQGAPVIYAYRPDHSVVWSYSVQNPHTSSPNWNEAVPSAISAGDIDGDGQPEIVFSMFFVYNYSPPPYETWVFVLDAATGSLQSSFSVPGISYSSVALPDLNGDGARDLVLDTYISDTQTGLIEARTAAGASLPGWPVPVPTSGIEGFGRIDPVISDAEGDGQLEVLVGAELRRADGSSKPGWPQIDISRSTGALAPLPDGECELEAVNGSSNSSVFHESDANGTVNWSRTDPLGSNLVILLGENGSQGNPVLADVDGDQKIDVVRPAELTTLVANSFLPIYGTNGAAPVDAGGFSRWVLNPNPGGNWSDPIRSTAAIGDLDGNGKVDMLIAAGGQLIRWDLNQPYEPGLDWWPMFQHDLRNTGVVATTGHFKPDLYIKDTPNDGGFEPNNVSTHLYVSSDIWVRNVADTQAGSSNPGPDTTLPADQFYTNEHQHENPFFFDSVTPNDVYVKVRNRGCRSSLGNERLRVYWADASTGLPWPGSGIWHELDCVPGGGIDPCQLPVVGPSQDYVARLPWIPPDPAVTGTDHYCLVARIESANSPPFGMSSPEGPVLWQNVAYNNNVSWKNVTVLRGRSSGEGTVVVRNTSDRAETLELRFGVPDAERVDSFLRHGEILVELGPELMASLRRSGRRPVGFIVVDNRTIRITEPTGARLSGLKMKPGQESRIKVTMQLRPGDNSAPGRQFTWDLEQWTATGKDKPTMVGGERYLFVVPTN